MQERHDKDKTVCFKHESNLIEYGPRSQEENDFVAEMFMLHHLEGKFQLDS